MYALLHVSSPSLCPLSIPLSAAGDDVWRRTYASPVMAVFAVERGNLRRIPSLSVATDTLSALTGSAVLALRTHTFGIKASDSLLQ